VIGCVFLLGGVSVTFAAIATTSSTPFVAGAAVAGVGFGLAFLGAFRSTIGLGAPDERAGLVAALFIVGYLAFSVPALLAGFATTRYGLRDTALVYSGSLAVLVAIALAILLLRRPASATAEAARVARALTPPGACTGPPCPQALGAAGGRAETPAGYGAAVLDPAAGE
jgi:hypothetical protein